DLGLGGRNGGKEGRLAGIGLADETGIGDELEAEPDALFDALLARIGAAGRLIGRGLEVGIAEAAIAALEQYDALADFGQVGDQGFLIFLKNLGALGHAQDDVFGIGAMAVLAHAMGAGI